LAKATQVSDVAHGPLVKISKPCFTEFSSVTDDAASNSSNSQKVRKKI
jgi:hypothetical protein